MEHFWSFWPHRDMKMKNFHTQKKAGLKGFEPLADRLRADCST